MAARAESTKVVTYRSARWRRREKRIAARRMRRVATLDPQEAPTKLAHCKSWYW